MLPCLLILTGDIVLLIAVGKLSTLLFVLLDC